MTYPSGNTAGIPPQYLGDETWVSDAHYAGGGYWAGYARGRHYSYDQLEGLWDNAGGDPSLAPLMAAIAENESGGWSGAWNSTGATSLWQIEYPGSAPPGISREQLFVPAENAYAAVKLSGNQMGGIGQNWSGDAALSGVGVLSGVPPAKHIPGAGKLAGSRIDLNPIHWITGGISHAAGGVAGRIAKDVEHFAIVVPIIAAAAGLGVLGLFLMTKGPRNAIEERTEDRAAEAAKIAAAAA